VSPSTSVQASGIFTLVSSGVTVSGTGSQMGSSLTGDTATLTVTVTGALTPSDAVTLIVSGPL